MDAIRTALRSDGIAADDLQVLTPTDRGEVLCFTTAGGDEAFRLWRRLRGRVATVRHWPVILGSPQEIELHRETTEVNPTPVGETLAYASTLDAPQWLARQQADRLAELRELNPGEDEQNFSAPLGDWPDEPQPNHQLLTPFDILSRKPHWRVAIGLVPTQAPWEVPAFLRLGGWNECPEAAVHCALHRHWHDRYGAVIAAATHDVIEMHVARPPTNRDDALALAREQYAYCVDIVEQGVGTLSNLAATTLNGSVWYLWWD